MTQGNSTVSFTPTFFCYWASTLFPMHPPILDLLSCPPSTATSPKVAPRTWPTTSHAHGRGSRHLSTQNPGLDHTFWWNARRYLSKDRIRKGMTVLKLILYTHLPSLTFEKKQKKHKLLTLKEKLMRESAIPAGFKTLSSFTSCGLCGSEISSCCDS